MLEAGDGEVGIRLQREQPADLVLTDIYMPGKGGLPTIQQLRQEWPTLKIVAITGGERTGPLFLSERAAAFGADRVLRKPFELRELLEVVQTLLDELPPVPSCLPPHAADPDYHRQAALRSEGRRVRRSRECAELRHFAGTDNSGNCLEAYRSFSASAMLARFASSGFSLIAAEQLDLARSLARQREATQERRAHLADILGTLWLQVANLRTQYDEAAFDSSRISARIRAITDNAKRYIEASAEAARLDGPRE